MSQLYKNMKLLFDVPELHERIAELEKELSSCRSMYRNESNFHEVAKEFNATALEDRLFARTVKRLTPILNEYAVDSLSRIMRRSQHNPQPYMQVAQESNSISYEVLVHFPAFSNVVRLVN